MDTIELVKYLTAQATKKNVSQLEDLDQVIEDALSERMNEAVRLVQEFDANKAYADLLKTFVYTQLTK